MLVLTQSFTPPPPLGQGSAGTKQQAAGSVSASPDLPSTVLSWSPAFIQITSPGPPHLYTDIVRGANFSLLALEIR